MATAAKFVKPIPIFLAYLIPLDVDAVSYYYYYYSSSFFLLPKVYPTHFSATTDRKSMKLHRNVKHYE
jgi:hypothetical protein